MAGTNITWQELTAPNLSGAAATMKDARDAILSGIGGFGDVAKGYNNIVNSDAATEFQRMVANNSLDALRQNPQALQDQFAGLSTDARKLVGADWLSSAIKKAEASASGSMLFDKSAKDYQDTIASQTAVAELLRSKNPSVDYAALMDKHKDNPAVVSALEQARRLYTKNNQSEFQSSANIAQTTANAASGQAQALESAARTGQTEVNTANAITKGLSESYDFVAKLDRALQPPTRESEENTRMYEAAYKGVKDDAKSSFAQAMTLLQQDPEMRYVPYSQLISMAQGATVPSSGPWGMFGDARVDAAKLEEAKTTAKSIYNASSHELAVLPQQRKDNDLLIKKAVAEIKAMKLPADRERQSIKELEDRYAASNKMLDDRYAALQNQAAADTANKKD